jgi:hypothetical protein
VEVNGLELQHAELSQLDMEDENQQIDASARRKIASPSLARQQMMTGCILLRMQPPSNGLVRLRAMARRASRSPDAAGRGNACVPWLRPGGRAVAGQESCPVNGTVRVMESGNQWAPSGLSPQLICRYLMRAPVS